MYNEKKHPSSVSGKGVPIFKMQRNITATKMAKKINPAKLKGWVDPFT